MKKAFWLILTLLAVFIPCACGESNDPEGTWYLQEMIIPEDIAEIHGLPSNHLSAPGVEAAVTISESGQILLQWTDNIGYNGAIGSVYDWNPDVAKELGLIDDTLFGESVGEIRDNRLYLDFSELTLICGREKPCFDLNTSDLDAYAEMTSGIDIWYMLTCDVFLPDDEYGEPEEGTYELLPPAFDSSEVIGKWYLQEITAVDLPFDSEYIGMQLDIHEDGTAVQQLMNLTQSVEWIISGNQILFMETESDYEAAIYFSLPVVTFQEHGTLIYEEEGIRFLFSREKREVKELPQPVGADSLDPFQGVWQLDMIIEGGILPGNADLLGETAVLSISGSSIMAYIPESSRIVLSDDSGEVFSGTVQLTDDSLSALLTSGNRTYPLTLQLCEDGTILCTGEWADEVFSVSTALSFVPVAEEADCCGRWYLESYSQSDGSEMRSAYRYYLNGILDLNSDGSFTLNMSGDMPSEGYESIAGETSGLWVTSGEKLKLQSTNSSELSFTFDPVAGTLLPNPYFYPGLMHFTRTEPEMISEKELIGTWRLNSFLGRYLSGSGMTIEFKKNGECIFTITLDDATEIQNGRWEFEAPCYLNAIYPDGQILRFIHDDLGTLSGAGDTICSMVKQTKEEMRERKIEETGEYDSFEYETYDNGEAAITGYTDWQANSVVVPKEINGCKVTEIGDGAFINHYKLTSIELPSTLKIIGFNAFAATGIRTLFIPESVEIIRDGAFSHMDDLISLFLPAELREYQDYGDMLSECSSALRIIIEADSVMAQHIRELYGEKFSLIEYTRGEACQSLSNYECERLGLPTHPSRELITPEPTQKPTATPKPTASPTPEPTPIPEPTAVPGIYEPANGAVVEVGQELFVSWGEIRGAKCYTIEVFENSNGAYIADWTSEEIPASETSCTIPYSILIGSSYEIRLTAWAEHSHSASGDKLYTASVEVSVHNKFTEAEENLQLTESASDQPVLSGGIQYQPCDDGTAIFLDAPGIEHLDIPETIDGYTITAIGEGACFMSFSLKSVSIPGTVTTIGAKAFAQCSYLEQVRFAEGLVSIGDSAFSSTHIQSLALPSTVTELGSYAFSVSSKLSTASLSENLTVMGEGVLSDCPVLKSISIPKGVAVIPENAFLCCTLLETVQLEEGLTEIGAMAFYGCEKLTRLSVPRTVTCIGEWAFASCTSLSDLTLPTEITLMDGSFFDCPLS